MIIQTSLKQSKPTLRVWRLSDAHFIVKVRNNPHLQRWFRQDHNLTIDEQVTFMVTEAPTRAYYGFIAEVNGLPIGVTALRLEANSKEAEFCIAILPEFQGRGLTKEVMRQLTSVAFNEFALNSLHGDVFANNPALSFFLWKCGFQVYGVREGLYSKKQHLIDVVQIVLFK